MRSIILTITLLTVLGVPTAAISSCTGTPLVWPSYTSDCDHPADSCTPLNPPPTPWNDGCCFEDKGVFCRDSQWRYQCCRMGNSYFWGVAYQDREFGAAFSCDVVGPGNHACY